MQWMDDLVNNWMSLKIANEMTNLNDLAKIQATVRDDDRLNRNRKHRRLDAVDTARNVPTEGGAIEEQDEDMRLNSPTYNVTQKESSMGKTLLGLGMLAAGVGGPATAWILTQRAHNPNAEVVTEVIKGESTTESIVVGEPIITTEP